MLIADALSIGIPFTLLVVIAIVATLVINGLLLLFALSTSRNESDNRGRSWLAKLMYVIFFATVVVLSTTSFGSMLQFGHMFGYALLAHVGVAGLFVFLLLGITALYLPRGGEEAELVGPADNRWWVARWSAWVMVFAGIVAAATMFLSMLPILGTEGLTQALMVHRYAGLIVLIAAIFHALSLLCTRFGLR